jgi:hypothetical protein
MHPRVAGVITREGTNISALCNEVADRYDFPPRLIVACAVMESNLHEQSERRGIWPDVSAGLFHQAVKWAKSYKLGDASASEENIAAVFDVLKNDLPRAADIAGRQLGHHWKFQQNGLDALSRYNAPSLEWANNPNFENILRGWNASAAFVVGDEVVYTPRIDHDRGTVSGTFSGAPTGIILHGSRSGTPRSTQEEYDLTRRFAASGTELGWNVTVGNDAICLHMSPREWGWNARDASPRHLACEFAQPTVDDEISDGQVRALCWWIQTEVLPVWPDLDVHSLPTHAELPAGGRDGKTDVFPRGDPRVTELRARIIACLNGETGEEDALSAEERAELNRCLSSESSLVKDTLEPLAATMDDILDGGMTKAQIVEKVKEMRNSIQTNVGV